MPRQKALPRQLSSGQAIQAVAQAAFVVGEETNRDPPVVVQPSPTRKRSYLEAAFAEADAREQAHERKQARVQETRRVAGVSEAHAITVPDDDNDVSIEVPEEDDAVNAKPIQPMFATSCGWDVTDVQKDANAGCAAAFANVEAAAVVKARDNLVSMCHQNIARIVSRVVYPTLRMGEIS